MPEEQHFEVECHTGLGVDTPILIGDQVITMKQLQIGYSGQSVNTFGINPENSQMEECAILEVPQELYAPDIVSIGLECGLHFECTPISLILTTKGYKEAGKLDKLEDKIQMILFNSDNGEFYLEEGRITTYNNEKKTLQIPVFLFVSNFENIMIPYYKEGSSMMAFINVKQ